MKEWKRKTNLEHSTTATLAALVVNALSREGSPRVFTEEFLPFKPPPHYLTIEQADAFFRARFGEMPELRLSEAAAADDDHGDAKESQNQRGKA